MTSQKIKDHYSDDVRLALLEQSITNINDTLVRFEKRFDNIDEQFKNIRSEMKSDFRWLLTIISALAGIMAHGFHWF
jgi:hypothetical protein